MTEQQMPARIALSELIELVEKASGPDRELDGDIAVMMGLYARRPVVAIPPSYTTSIDAALTLLPNGYAVEGLSIWKGAQASCHVLGTHIHNGEYWHEHKDGRWRAECATPALATVAACLKARLAMPATQDTEAPHD